MFRIDTRFPSDRGSRWDMTTSVPDSGPFPQSALAVNASGRLTDDQRKLWRASSRGFRKSELTFAALAVAIGALVAFSPGPAKYATIKPIIGGVCFVIAALLVVRSLTGGDSVTEDVRAGRVESVEGAIAKRRVTAQGRGTITSYFLDVAGKRLHVGHLGYDAAPDAGYVRIYFLPRSHHVVNLERLPDPPVPDITPTSVHEAMQGFATARHTHQETAIAEARAQMAAMATQFTSQLQQAAVPPPSDQRDPRPLAVAIVGSWANTFMSIAFAPDGTVTQTMPNGRQRSGRWSVDAQGHLHADALGHDEAGDAWVAGDTLTVSAQGMALTFTRQNG